MKLIFGTHFEIMFDLMIKTGKFNWCQMLNMSAWSELVPPVDLSLSNLPRLDKKKCVKMWGLLICYLLLQDYQWWCSHQESLQTSFMGLRPSSLGKPKISMTWVLKGDQSTEPKTKPRWVLVAKFLKKLYLRRWLVWWHVHRQTHSHYLILFIIHLLFIILFNILILCINRYFSYLKVKFSSRGNPKMLFLFHKNIPYFGTNYSCR